MRPDDIGLLAFGLIVVLVVLLVVWGYRRRSRDEIFTGITPGELPGLGHDVRRARVPDGREYAGPVAVRFTPPDGVTPGLVGTVIDGRADSRDLSATLVDLAVRGYLRIRPQAEVAAPGAASDTPGTTPGEGERAPGGRHTDHDYVLVVPESTPSFDGLLDVERTLLAPIYAASPSVHLRALGPDFAQAMRVAQVGLYREVVERHWYAEHPRIERRRLGCLLTPLLVLLGAVLALGVWSLRERGEASLVGFALPVGVLVAAYLLFRGARTRSARTAEGTAVRIQALGFRDYLTKAEASQIRFEQARDLFNRYLPYAIVFGVADRWARVFGEVAARARASGWSEPLLDLGWIDVVQLADLAGDLTAGGLHLLDALSASDGLSELADLGGFADVGDLGAAIGDALGGVAGARAISCPRPATWRATPTDAISGVVTCPDATCPDCTAGSRLAAHERHPPPARSPRRRPRARGPRAGRHTGAGHRPRRRRADRRPGGRPARRRGRPDRQLARRRRDIRTWSSPRPAPSWSP